MAGDAVFVIVFVLVFGCAAFLFGILYLVCRLIGGAGRCMIRVLSPPGERVPERPVAPESKGLMCTHGQCRRIEYRSRARFCSQCGAPLTEAFSEKQE